jgi:hypothetical protein
MPDVPPTPENAVPRTAAPHSPKRKWDSPTLTRESHLRTQLPLKFNSPNEHGTVGGGTFGPNS